MIYNELFKNYTSFLVNSEKFGGQTFVVAGSLAPESRLSRESRGAEKLYVACLFHAHLSKCPGLYGFSSLSLSVQWDDYTSFSEQTKCLLFKSRES